MLWAIFVSLLALWFVGIVTGMTLGGFIHVLLLLAVVPIIVRVIVEKAPL
jgi:hypothetical protein